MHDEAFLEVVGTNFGGEHFGNIRFQITIITLLKSTNLTSFSLNGLGFRRRTSIFRPKASTNLDAESSWLLPNDGLSGPTFTADSTIHTETSKTDTAG